MLNHWLDRLPLIAILRGVPPEEVCAIGRALSEAGFRILEVPLNSPRPMASIRLLADTLDENHLIGAGTVTTTAEVMQVAEAGGKLVVMPHADTEVIRAAKAAGMVCTPGVATPTEAMAALAAGADGLKIFPAGQVGPESFKAWRAVLPTDVPIMPVGGIQPDNMASWVTAGAHGFGIGSSLYKPGMSADEVARRGRTFVRAWAALATSDSRENRS